MQKIIAADKVFTGTEWLDRCAVVIERDSIREIISNTDVPAGTDVLQNVFLAPAFIDVQVYGTGSKLFANYPAPETLQMMQESFSAAGTAVFQPTLATNTPEVFRKGIDAVRNYQENGGRGVWGLHLEGPWLNADKKGAHVKELIHAPNVDEVKDLLEYGKGVISMITLAPEVCSDEVIELILSYGIVISAGHSNATYEQGISAFQKGISTVTHLYNAMSGLHHREPGLVGAVLNHGSVYSSIIPDGHHVNFEAIAIAKKIMGKRLFAITDAVAETSEGYYQHQFVGDKYEVEGTLSGSAISMYQAFLNLTKEVGIGMAEAHRMCSLYPARVLKCSDRYGELKPGAAAEVLVLSDNLELLEVVSGQKA